MKGNLTRLDPRTEHDEYSGEIKQRDTRSPFRSETPTDYLTWDLRTGVQVYVLVSRRDKSRSGRSPYIRDKKRSKQKKTKQRTKQEVRPSPINKTKITTSVFRYRISVSRRYFWRDDPCSSGKETGSHKERFEDKESVTTRSLFYRYKLYVCDVQWGDYRQQGRLFGKNRGNSPNRRREEWHTPNENVKVFRNTFVRISTVVFSVVLTSKTVQDIRMKISGLWVSPNSRFFITWVFLYPWRYLYWTYTRIN